ncbi:RES family NAD+ phosphorylase [Stappia sp.]|uniref:RES family NAD+ phosphorylase n=1 Tax=Stappia sp. TaxID=1870903 RepID=UPI0032D9A01F
MRVWRLSNYRDLSGRGGLVASGRWHNRGRAVVYCAESFALARIEVEEGLGLPPLLWPDSFCLLRISVPATATVEELAPQDLPDSWRDDPLVTRRIGDAWLRGTSAPLLRVPSARAQGFNYLINPVHRLADFLEVERVFTLDEMLAGDVSERG